MSVAARRGPIDVYHNVRWARYKGAVFTELAVLADAERVALRIVQIADTEGDRIALAPVDLSFHGYPHELLFEGAYDAVPRRRLLLALATRVARTDARLIVLPGYHRAEHWAMLLVARLRGVRCGVFCDSTAFDRPQSRIKSIAKKLFFSRCAVVFCYGSRSREYAVMHGARPDRVFDGVQAAALDRSYRPDDAFRARIARAPAADRPRYLFVGRIAPEKDLPTLLHAFATLRRSVPHASLQLVGTGGEASALRTLAATLGISNVVTFAGALTGPALADAYLSATCLVLASRSEPWGLVVNEALSHGCPAIVSDRCGCAPDLVEPKVNGDVVPCGQVDALAAAMIDTLRWSADPARTARACIDSISRHTPRHAAMRMMHGCTAALGD